MRLGLQQCPLVMLAVKLDEAAAQFEALQRKAQPEIKALVAKAAQIAAKAG